MTNQQKVPIRGKAVYSDEGKGGPGSVLIGPVVSEFLNRARVRHGQICDRDQAHSMIGAGSKWTTRLVNQGRSSCGIPGAHFPTTQIKEGKSTHEIPFGSDRSPCGGIEFPAQNWVDYSDGRRGLALLNIELVGQPGLRWNDMLVLGLAARLTYTRVGELQRRLRAVECRRSTGFQLGRERTMHYALVPHEGDWRGSGVFRDGWEFNHPLVCRTVLPHEGSLPKSWGTWSKSPVPTSSSHHSKPRPRRRSSHCAVLLKRQGEPPWA